MKRIQLKRTKGWRMPPNTKIVDRRSKKFGNPYTPTKTLTVDNCIYSYRLLVTDIIKNHDSRLLDELRQYDNLACWCKLDAPCHADVLIELLGASE